ncbi:CubicO group peptidase, beta-lactamase class C family [Rhizobium sp. RU35A]|nr:CubicO group peptidase, beta-lactamase class C family [Rhizobium sp. RU35A]
MADLQSTRSAAGRYRLCSPNGLRERVHCQTRRGCGYRNRREVCAIGCRQTYEDQRRYRQTTCRSGIYGPVRQTSCSIRRGTRLYAGLNGRGRLSCSRNFLAAKASNALWPAGDGVELSDDKRLLAVLNDPALQGPGMRAIVVVHDGHIVGETYGAGFAPSTPLLGWSMTKTVNAALVGLVIKDGKLSLDQKSLFSQWANDARKDISVADLMSMTSGLKWSEEGNFPDTYILEDLAEDAAAFARDRPLVALPGTKFNYSSGSSVLLARLWQDAVGADAQAFPQERLFKPLGMTSAVLETDPSGTFLGEAHLYANARDWARFGEFLRLNGAWNGEQLLPSDFVDYMRSPVQASDEGHGPAYGRGQLWLGPGQGFPLPDDAFMMQGHLRQVIAIIPSLKLVILRMGLTREDIGFSNAKLLHAIVAALRRS